MSITSRPAFSARVIGTTSIALAKASIAICSRPPTLGAYFLSFSANSISVAPPPVTILPSWKTRETTPMASARLRSISSTTCSLPPRTKMETALGFLQPVTKVISSSPIFLTSTTPANPRSCLLNPSMLETTLPPVALARASISDFLALRIAIISCLAK